MFQNGTNWILIQFSAFKDIAKMLGYCRTLGKVRLFYVITKKLLAFFRKPPVLPWTLRDFRKPTSPPLNLKSSSKTHQSSLTLKEGSTSLSKPLPSQKGKDVSTALSIVFTTPSVPLVGDRNGARNHFILWMADHQRSTPAAELRFFVRGWTRFHSRIC